MKVKKTVLEKALRAWLTSPAGATAGIAGSLALGNPDASLRLRLEQAFTAGAEWAAGHLAQRTKRGNR